MAVGAAKRGGGGAGLGPAGNGGGRDGPAAGAAPPRVAGRRAALPNGRAVLGGLLVAVAAVGTYAAWAGADDAPTTTFAVAARDIAVGEVLSADDVELLAMDVPDAVAEAAFGAGAAGLLDGQVAVAPLAAGDLVQRSAVVVPEDAEAARQLSFSIDTSAALAGTLEEGERVDVLATVQRDGDTGTEVVAAGATVARIVSDDGGRRLVLLLSVTDDTDLLGLTTAARRGDLTLVRTTPGAPPG